MNSKHSSLHLVVLACSLSLALGACTNAGRLKSEAASLESEIRQLKAQGALQTSPREVAIAEANLDFFFEEYQERDYWAAEDALAHVKENIEKASIEANLGLDLDRDGVWDMDDLCPEDPGPPDTGGCPAEMPAGLTSRIVPWGEVSRQIFFEPGSARLMRFSRKALEPVAASLIEDPTMHLAVVGHTDSVGDAEKNLILSRRRAEAVKAVLIELSVDPAQVSTVGYGESMPIASNDTPEGRQRNRRVEIRPE